MKKNLLKKITGVGLGALMVGAAAIGTSGGFNANAESNIGEGSVFEINNEDDIPAGVEMWSQERIDEEYNKAFNKFVDLSFDEQKSSLIDYLEECIVFHSKSKLPYAKEDLESCKEILNKVKVANSSDELIDMVKADLTLVNYLLD